MRKTIHSIMRSFSHGIEKKRMSLLEKKRKKYYRVYLIWVTSRKNEGSFIIVKHMYHLDLLLIHYHNLSYHHRKRVYWMITRKKKNETNETQFQLIPLMYHINDRHHRKSQFEFRVLICRVFLLSGDHSTNAFINIITTLNGEYIQTHE